MNQDEQRQRRRAGSLRAQTARTKHTAARQRRGRRRTLYGGVGIAALAVIAIVAGMLMSGSGPELGQPVEPLPGRHTTPYAYTTQIPFNGEERLIPPTSGNHTDARSAYGFLGAPLVAENVVHNMEHGAVVIWYQPGDPALAGQVNQLLARVGGECLLAGSYIYMDFPVAATVWGRVLALEAFDAAALEAFIQAYRGKKGPEAGVCLQES